MNAAIVEAVVSQHAEEAAILWLRRDWAVDQPHYLLADLTGLDEQLEAHLDGLRIGGQAAWEICMDELRWGAPGEIFAPAVLAFESGSQARIDRILEASHVSEETMSTAMTAADTYEFSRPVAAALAWLSGDRAEPFIERFLSASSPRVRRLAIAAAAAHRRDPGTVLTDALAATDLSLRARALRAAGELGRGDLLPDLRTNLTADDSCCRVAAAWSLALLAGGGDAIEVLRQTAELNHPWSEKALKLASRRLDIAPAFDWIKRLAIAEPERARRAMIGAGGLGIPDCVPLLLEGMRRPELARVAGEGFSMITGVDIAYDGMEGTWPKDFFAGPTEDPNDENVAMDRDEYLPWPDRDEVSAWWRSHQGYFKPGIRYLLGKPVEPDWLQEVLQCGRQRQRAAAVLELAIQRPGRPLFEVRAPGFRQQQRLSVKQPY